MNRAINGALLGLVLFLAGYCVCFWFGIMPKFYPLTNEIHVTPPPGQTIAVKFVGSAVVGAAAGLVGLLIGLALPRGRGAVALHLLTWAALLGASAYLFGRETVEYILH